ncbi:MAG: hypothetical protein MUF54_22280 [Polyangiaceae bacterium]|nr:hypothetical protein [Polyangiaceae bacterium]
MQLLVTLPTRVPDTDPAQHASIYELADRFGGKTIEVEPLRDDEMSELLLSQAALDAEVVVAACRRSKGIPLFALQLVHAWANGGSLEMRGGRYCVKRDAIEQVPATTSALWDERLAALPQQALHARAVPAVGAGGTEQIPLAARAAAGAPVGETRHGSGRAAHLPRGRVCAGFLSSCGGHQARG